MGNYLRFEWTILCVSFRSAWNFFKKHIFIELFFAFVSSVASILYNWDGSEVAETLIEGLTIGLIATALMLLSIFVGNLVSAPYKLWKRDKDRINELNKKLENHANTNELPNTIPLVELLKEAETQGWQFTADGSQHIFHFTSALRDAGSTGEIQFWGREVQHIQDHTRDKALTEIGSDMWKGALIRPLSCLENSSDGTTRVVSDNFRTAVEREALQGDLRKDIHLNRKQALSWLQHQAPQSLFDTGERQSN